jgi:hypothetical protein
MCVPLKPEVKKVISFKEQKQLFKKAEQDKFVKAGK